jgi:hypothetical protein
MGMYTQVRGWLNVDSISYGNKNLSKIVSLLADAQTEFKELHEGRSWVCEDTTIHKGSNGSVFLFFGTELKNYDNDAEEWIEHLIKYYPNVEGRIDFQYEEEDHNDEQSTSKYWLIKSGEIIKEDWNKTWCKGYGNSFD